MKKKPPKPSDGQKPRKATPKPPIPAKPLSPKVAALAEEIGSQVRLIRERRGLSQADVQQRTGIDRANWRKYEKGQMNLTIETLLELAAILDADVVVKLRERKTSSPAEG